MEIIDYTGILEEILTGVELIQGSMEKAIQIVISLFLIMVVLKIFKE